MLLIWFAMVHAEKAKKAEAARVAGIGEFATRHGLAFSPGEFAGAEPGFWDRAFHGAISDEEAWLKRIEHIPTLALGHSRSAANFVTGRIDGMDVLFFDYEFKITTSTGKTTTTTTHPFGILEVAVPIDLPGIDLAPEVWGQSFFSGKDVQFESDEFNREWRVTANDARAAHDLVHPRTMELLLASAGYRWVLAGPRIHVVKSGGKPTAIDYETMLRELRAFVALIPGYVREDRPA